MSNLRIGHGYDAHKLTVGRALILGGVKIPNERGLLGHSDADVLVHAIIDAILGALAMGDIGQQFPDNDPAYKDSDSIVLLEKVRWMMEKLGWRIGNIDATIVAQQPKLSPYLLKMRETIAKACAAGVTDINVKATTEEKMGFTGQGEGICAHAVCILERG